MNEKDFLKNFAKVLGAESKFEEIEEKRQKEKRMLESLGARFGIGLAEEVVKEVPSTLISQPIVEPEQNIIEVSAPVLVEEAPTPQTEVVVENVIPPLPKLPVETIVTKSVKMISKAVDTQSVVDKIDDPLRRELDAMKKTIADLHRYARNTSQMGGGGEVNLRYLDDVDRGAIQDDKYLRYEASTKKFTFDSGHKNNFYGAFQSSVSQYCNATTATPFTYNQTDFSYGVTIQNDSHICITNPGTYNVQFSIQLINAGTNIDQVNIWLRQGGVDVAGSNGKIDIQPKHGSLDGALIVGWNYYIQTTVPNDYFELMWFTLDENHTSISALPEQAAVPGVSPLIPSTASIILTVSPVKIDSN